ncbi:MAG: pstS, partial [Aeromicrobium sp.]|nr:pstS [Aeromicrobium sp.]
TTDIAVDVDRKTTEAGVYPIVLASYQIACQTPADKKSAELIKAWLTYVASDEGQKAAAATAGSAPLTPEFGKKVQAAIETIAAA